MKTKSVIIIVITLVIFLIIISLFVFSNKKATTGVNIIIVPSDSEIMLDGKVVPSGTNSTKPGKHTVEVKRKDFDNNKLTVNVVSNQIQLVTVGLSPNNSIGIKWQKEHQKEYLELENIGDIPIQQNSADILKKYPIIANLPQDMSPIYRIDYGISKKYPGDTLKIAIYISSDNPTDQLTAINKIYEMGYDPSDYEIIFESL